MLCHHEAHCESLGVVGESYALDNADVQCEDEEGWIICFGGVYHSGCRLCTSCVHCFWFWTPEKDVDVDNSSMSSEEHVG